jgi:WD40 repeat protein
MIRDFQNGQEMENIHFIKILYRILYFLQINQQFSLHVNFYINLGSSDGTLQIVDMRVGNYKNSDLSIKAHEKDVNVCDWNRSNPNLIVTGSDDCLVKVWDLRKIK